MNDYGFTPGALFGLTMIESYRPLDTDVYDPQDEYKGNSCARIRNTPEPANGRLLHAFNQKQIDECLNEREEETHDMLTPQMGAIDVRLFFWERPSTDWSQCRWVPGGDMPEFWSYSHVSQN